jgi:hypothetical protein
MKTLDVRKKNYFRISESTTALKVIAGGQNWFSEAGKWPASDQASS